MTKKKNSRKWLTLGTLVLIAGGVTLAFWPKPTLVDIGAVTSGSLVVTLDEDARTEVHDTYIISAPISGRLLRIQVEAGDRVEQGQSIVAHMLPVYPPALDVRAQKQAEAAVKAAEATLAAANAHFQSARADKDLANTKAKRARTQMETGAVSQSEVDEAERALKVAQAAVESGDAMISLRKAELANAKAALTGTVQSDSGSEQPISIKSPINGRILNVIQKNETTLAAGTPLLEIGDVEGDLEVVAELLSTDAVQVKVGDRVNIENWGGAHTLTGTISRIDPFAFTKYSALGVEEQRVKVYVRFNDPKLKTTLGHGYRVEVRIVVWEKNGATLVPSSALFRTEGEWAVFIVEDGLAQARSVSIERDNGHQASVLEGLMPNDQVILYPPSELEDGAKVAQR